MMMVLPRRRGGVENLLLNTVFAGAVSGSLGTLPTAWGRFTDGTPTLTVNGETLQVTTSLQRYQIVQTRSVAANTIYYYSIIADIIDAAQFWNHCHIAIPPAGATLAYEIDGAGAANTTVPGVGVRTLGVKLTVAETAGTASFRFGSGIQGPISGDIIFSQPQLEVGTARGAYSPVTATS